MLAYDLIQEGEKIRRQLREALNPVVEARNMMSQAILTNVLQALSDNGFYEYLNANPEFNIQETEKRLALDSFVFNALVDYLVGRGLLKKREGTCSLTPLGEIFFNAYTRGLCNVYWGGYKANFYHLSEALNKKISLEDPKLTRSSYHVATGTSQLTCAFTIPKVLEYIDTQNCRTVLDLGCGTGDFLMHIARLNSSLYGVGIDMSVEAIQEAERRAEGLLLQERLKFFAAEVGKNSLDIPEEFLEKIDIVICMYMLHEFGRDGDGAIIEVLQSLKKQLAGKLFLLLETEDCALEDASPKDHYGQLDYRLIHLLSRQGLPKKLERWHAIFEEARCPIVEPGVKIGGSYIYIVRL